MEQSELINALNRMLAEEHACAIRYATHAAVITGPYAEAVASRLKEISSDEMAHAERLRDRILGLGGEPTMEVSSSDLIEAESLDQILEVNIGRERAAIRDYTEILKSIPPSNVLLFQTVQEIIRDEQEHLEELEALKPRD